SVPGYPTVRVSAPHSAQLARRLRAFQPDVVHLASPFLLGWQALAAADDLRLPTVAVYQTDVVAYASRYGLPRATVLAEHHLARLHRRATLTLAPSTASIDQLTGLGVDRVSLWARGVDLERFHPGRRSEQWRTQVAPGQIIVGYVGRLAPEKQVGDLAVLRGIPGVRLVVVGDGPERAALQRLMPDAAFLGHLSGSALAEVVASFDLFVHPGESETFGQTIQEAMASGVPVIATGRGGPLDLVHSSIDGWLYRPGDFGELRARVADLVGDPAKRRAFGASARDAVGSRSWPALSVRLVEHYERARRLHRLDDSRGRRRALAYPRPDERDAASRTPPWRRYVALGDSITEGLCDASRMPDGHYRGWADRLAHLLALSGGGGAAKGDFRYANLAVRSRTVAHLIDEQLPAALRLRPDLVSVLIGANDLVGIRPDVPALAAAVEGAAMSLRASGCEVLLVTPFLPHLRTATLLARRFARFNAELRRIAVRSGAMLLDIEAHPALGALEFWADDRVHLRSSGHRFVAYQAAAVLGVPDAAALAGLDEALHADEDPPREGTWLRRDALPWAWRRLRGRTAGDGLSAKHSDYVAIADPDSQDRARQG
ncbi:GDSL-type esterase/lipase family protein, partial [Microbacterium sp.]|uniref:GDSL-type esterase/lipase family protein n=1 Tax=Microbacterium sp. TaxID=51671 RepID=UPI003C74BA91